MMMAMTVREEERWEGRKRFSAQQRKKWGEDGYTEWGKNGSEIGQTSFF